MNVDLYQAIQQSLDQFGLQEIVQNAEELSLDYRSNRTYRERFVQTPQRALSYAATRMPATYGAAKAALKHTLDCLGQTPPCSFLDVGAGTGAMAWAIASLLEFPHGLCLEREMAMSELGQQLMGFAPQAFARVNWQSFDLLTDPLSEQAQLVTAAYMLNEMDVDSRTKAIAKLWQATRQLLIIIEPGTPAGFNVINQVRQQLLGVGGHLVAPCPAGSNCEENYPCPAINPNWCHFTCRIPRSRTHMQLKNASVPYEDEKYSFVAVSREQAQPAAARVLRHPQIRKGNIGLELCSGGQIVLRTVSKRQIEAFRAARKANAGDRFDWV